jgi:beta-N-acetylhexosaminidase
VVKALFTGQLLCVGIAGARLSRGERRAFARFKPGAVILFKRNYDDPAHLAALCREIHRSCQPAPLISVDQEGGRVARLGHPFIRLAAGRALRRQHTPAEVEELVAAMAAELHGVGIEINFAPVLDVLTNPANQPIGERAFGTTASVVEHYGLAFMRGLLRGGVVPCGKHFPGHGMVREDSHFELPISRVSQRSLFDVHLQPFGAAIAAGLPMIMLSHVIMPCIDPERPASLSGAMVNEILRRRLGFTGVVTTDDLQMAALGRVGALDDRAAAALEAGVDLVLVCREIEDAESVFATIGRISRSPVMRPRIDASVGRIAALRRLVRTLPVGRSAAFFARLRDDNDDNIVGPSGA